MHETKFLDSHRYIARPSPFLLFVIAQLVVLGTVIAQTTAPDRDALSVRDQIQDNVERDPDLTGVLVTEVRLDADGRAVVVGLVGRDDQKEQLGNEVLGVLGSDSHWKARVEGVNEERLLSGVITKPADRSRSSVYMAEALRAVYMALQGDPSKLPYATACFDQAIRNEPRRAADVGYWRALTALMMGRRDRAHDLLVRLQERKQSRSRELMMGMQRVQGPVRGEFENMIRDALLSDSR